MKKFIFILFQLILPVFVYGDDGMILSKDDAQNMFSMAKENWIQNVKNAKTSGVTFPCPDRENLTLCIDTGIAFMATVPKYLQKEIYPNAINVVIQYKTPNFLTEKQFEKVVKKSKKEMSPEYHVDGIWGTLPEEKYTVVTFVITKASDKQIENRVIAYGDDGMQAWFTFKYDSEDIFTLSFAGSGDLRGVWIVKGRILSNENTLCLIQTEDPNKILQNLIKNFFVPKYGLSGSIDVDPNNTIGMVKGKISNTILYFFLSLAQDSKNTKAYLNTLGCNQKN